jgi:hypothetical protein
MLTDHMHRYHSINPAATMQAYVCDACGSIIADKHLHDEWHDYMVSLLVYRDE